MDTYTILHKLGEGGFGEVYKAECTVAGITYTRALKRLEVDIRNQTGGEDRYGQIRKEIDALMEAGRHPNIVKYIDNIIEERHVWLVLEYCNGGTLDSFILSRNLDRATTLQLLCDMAEGVAYLHGKNIVHRDLKLDNILVENSGPRPIAKIADFGLARECGLSRVVWSDLNSYYMDSVAGTVYYWPPELYRIAVKEDDSVFQHIKTLYDEKVKYTAKTDIWTMGIIIAAILGRMIDPLRPEKLLPRLLVHGKGMPVAKAVFYPDFCLADSLMTSEPPRSPVKALTLSMLAVDPHQRPTAEQVLNRLKEITNPPNRVPQLSRRTKDFQWGPGSQTTQSRTNVRESPAVPMKMPVAARAPAEPAQPSWTPGHNRVAPLSVRTTALQWDSGLQIMQSTCTTNFQEPPPMHQPPLYTVVEIPVESSESQQTGSCCAACWKWDSDKQFYSLVGKGPGWVIVLLILWIVFIAAVFLLFPILYCYYLYCHEHCCDDS